MLVLVKLWEQLSLLPQWLLSRRRTSSTSALLLCVRELTDIFYWPLDKFLYLILLPLGILTLGDKVSTRRAKGLKYLTKLGKTWQTWKCLLFLRENYPCWTNGIWFPVMSLSLSTALQGFALTVLPYTNTWLGHEVRLNCQGSRSAEDNYTDLLISLFENCNKTSDITLRECIWLTHFRQTLQDFKVQTPVRPIEVKQDKI